MWLLPLALVSPLGGIECEAKWFILKAQKRKASRAFNVYKWQDVW